MKLKLEVLPKSIVYSSAGQTLTVCFYITSHLCNIDTFSSDKDVDLSMTAKLVPNWHGHNQHLAHLRIDLLLYY